MISRSARPIRLAIVNDYDVVVAGVTAMLAPYADRVEVVELDNRALLTGSVDVVLLDTFGQLHHERAHLRDLVAQSKAQVVVFTWSLNRPYLDQARGDGAAGYLSKALTAAEIVEGLEAIHAGEPVPPHLTEQGDKHAGDWPGSAHGLSLRESEVLVYITQGLSNLEIAETCYLGINTVKTYVRTTYRKIGVTRRSQAVRFGILHGFEPERTSAVQRGPVEL